MGLHVTPRSSVSGGSERGRDGSSQMVGGGVESIRVSDSFFTALALSPVISHTVRRSLGRTPAPAPASSSCSRGNRNKRIFFWNQLLFLLFFWYCHFNNLNVSEICVCDSDLVCVTVLREFD